MQLSDIFLGLGESALGQLLKSISIGKLKTFQMYERMKTRLHVPKVNSETLRKSEPRCWARLSEHDEEFATEIAQAILISHMDMISAVLDFLGIPHEEGFFAKDLEGSKYLTGDWRERTFAHFQGRFPDAVLLFYINHLGWELLKQEQLFTPAAAA